MARQCEICEKRGLIVWNRNKLRGKYNPTVKRKQRPNLQQVLVPVGLKTKKQEFKQAEGKKVLICSKCRKTILKYGA